MVFLFWVVMALVVAVVANGKGRSGFAWFLYGLLLWPVALAHICVIRRPEPARPIVVAAEQDWPGEAVAPAPAAGASHLQPLDYVRPARLAPEGREWSYRQDYRSKIRGVTKDNEDGTPRQELIADLTAGDALTLARDPGNANDVNAIRVLSPRLGMLGYIGADLAVTLAPLLDDPDIALVARVLEVTRNELGGFLGVIIEIGDWRAVEAARPPSADSKLSVLPNDPSPVPVSWSPSPAPRKPVPMAGIVGVGLLVVALYVVVRLNAPSEMPVPQAAPAHAPVAATPTAPVTVALPAIAGPFTQTGGRTLTRPEIAELQATLNRIGFDVGTADGVAGPRTRGALREIERQAGWGEAPGPVAAHLDWVRARAR